MSKGSSIKSFLVFIFVIAILGGIVYFVVNAMKDKKNTYYKLYKIYSKDSTFNCNLNQICTKTETIVKDDKTYTVDKKMTYNSYDKIKSSYSVNIHINDDEYFQAWLRYDEFVDEVVVDFATKLSGNNYDGYLLLETKKIMFTSNIFGKVNTESEEYNRFVYLLNMSFDIMDEEFSKVDNKVNKDINKQ